MQKKTIDGDKWLSCHVPVQFVHLSWGLFCALPEPWLCQKSKKSINFSLKVFAFSFPVVFYPCLLQSADWNCKADYLCKKLVRKVYFYFCFSTAKPEFKEFNPSIWTNGFENAHPKISVSLNVTEMGVGLGCPSCIWGKKLGRQAIARNKSDLEGSNCVYILKYKNFQQFPIKAEEIAVFQIVRGRFSFCFLYPDFFPSKINFCEIKLLYSKFLAWENWSKILDSLFTGNDERKEMG